MEQDASEALHYVVINHEEQYLICPGFKEVPLGWSKIGEAQGKEQYLDYIEENWTDMRPLSLRKRLEEENAL